MMPPELPRQEVPLQDGSSWGDPGAPLIVVEFSNYTCGYCARMAKVLDEVLADYPGKVLRVFRHFGSPDNTTSTAAAIAGLCALAQGKHAQVHASMYANQGSLSVSNVVLWAEQAELDMAAFEACRADPAMASRIERDRLDGLRLGVDGTPTLFLNGQRLVGLQPPVLLKAYLEAELARRDRTR